MSNLPQNITRALALLRSNSSGVLIGAESIEAHGAIDLLERELEVKYSTVEHASKPPTLHSRSLKALRWVEETDGADIHAKGAPTISVLDMLFHNGMIETHPGGMIPIFKLTDKGRDALKGSENG